MALAVQELFNLSGGNSDEATYPNVGKSSLADPSINGRGLDFKNGCNFSNGQKLWHRAPPEPAKD
jgi:hypothetical protein